MRGFTQEVTVSYKKLRGQIKAEEGEAAETQPVSQMKKADTAPAP